MVVLETERLTLRRLTESDVDILVELDSDPRVMQFLTGGQPTSRATIENELIPRLLKEYERGDGRGRWAAIEKGTGEFIGWFALDPPDGVDTEAELGYRLRADAWGKGYATEGSRALIHKAFTELNLQRVWAQTMAVNTPSRRVMERVGLKYVRTLHLTFDDPIPGTEQGEVEYELTRDQYSPAMTKRGPVVVLVGPPGSGKTTIGKAIADTLGVEFRDTDADIVKIAGKPITEIFTDDGESAFRAMEEKAVETGLTEHGGVLALGGGAVLSARTRGLLAGHRVAFLNIGLAEGVRRTGLSSARPLLAGINPRAKFRELLEARLPLYREVATVEVGTDDRAPGDLAAEILAVLGLVGT